MTNIAELYSDNGYLRVFFTDKVKSLLSKRAAILQSNYIPWKGYFDLINSVDEFIILDEVQYTKNDWRNRNKIKTPEGLFWLTIPVLSKGNFGNKISEIRIKDTNWQEKHWKSIVVNYARAKCFNEYRNIFEELYSGTDTHLLSEINLKFIHAINAILGIKTKISMSCDFRLLDAKTERLIDLCKQVQADEYISGPAAKDYIVEELFREANIKLTWMDYGGYGEYGQLYPPFNHFVSIIDLIFNEGKDSTKFMKTFNHA